MTERYRPIEKLVLNLHLNADERKSLGTEPVLKSEIASVLLSALKCSGRFPPNSAPWQPGQCVCEGYFHEVLQDGKVRLWWQRSFANNPSQLAEQRHWGFHDSAQAVNEFVKREWAIGHIDGVTFSD